MIFRDPVPLFRDPIILNDGTTVSVQANRASYCTPRNDIGPYTSVEVGFPSVRPSWWNEHSSGDEIAGWVPVSLVREFIEEHGGLASGDLPEGVL